MPEKHRARTLHREAVDLIGGLDRLHRELLEFEKLSQSLHAQARALGHTQAGAAIRDAFAQVDLAGQHLVRAHLALNEPFLRRQRRRPGQEGRHE